MIRWLLFLCFLLITALLAGCVAVTPAASTPTAAPLATLPAAQPTATPAFATAMVAVVEIATVTPEVFNPVPTQAAYEGPLAFYLIALEDGGTSGAPVGCGDSLVPVTLDRPTGGEDPLRYAVEQLLKLKDDYFGESGLYNALYQSDLTVESLKVEGAVAELRLSGELMLGGVCDSPRVQAQLEKTVLQQGAASSVNIFVNDVPLADLLSGSEFRLRS